MQENSYTTRELDYHFSEIKETLNRIETQTLKTNGRVSKLEQWKWIITGAIIALGALNAPALKEVVSIVSAF